MTFMDDEELRAMGATEGHVACIETACEGLFKNKTPSRSVVVTIEQAERIRVIALHPDKAHEHFSRLVPDMVPTLDAFFRLSATEPRAHVVLFAVDLEGDIFGMLVLLPASMINSTTQGSA